jgi:hypothetical protein
MAMKSVVILTFMLAGSLAGQTFSTGRELLTEMHKKYYQSPCKCYTFSQKNTHYKADTVSGHSEWHEMINFPDKFRINFGDSAKKNFVWFRNDSAYNYKNGIQVKARADTNSLLLILGGMYYRPLESVLTRLQNAGYDLAVVSSQLWNSEPVFTIGASKNNLTVNQIWVSQKDFRVLRIIEKLSESEMMDMRFESHQKWCKGFVETKVSFRRNGKLEQVEEYYDLKEAKCK